MTNSSSPSSPRTIQRSFGVRTVVGLFAIASVWSCSDQPDLTGGPCTTSIITERLQQGSLDKIDILLAIDNSRSMADKQQILASAVPDLVKSLLNPRCIDEMGQPAAQQPAGPLENCPVGTTREFPQIYDVHLGVISSSLGGHGADSCPNVETNSVECAPNPNTTNNDHGHLLARLDPCAGQEAPTFMNKKFLAWDPTNRYGGETVIDNGSTGIVPTLRDMVLGTGQIGCGYESQLESIYRFLADPNPYETIVVDNLKAIPMGTDDVLLKQRMEFMRPDSLLAIVMLTDENDCSIKEFGQFYYAGQLRNGASPVRLPRARQECAQDPHDPCCKSCGQSQDTCPHDPTCEDPNGGTGPALLSDAEDHINLRCWDQKRRFGIDFLYPTDRYVTAFSNATIADRDGNIVPNPIFSDLDPTDANSHTRDSSLVFLAGIVGVPWQDIARDKTDLKKGFKDAYELTAEIDGSGVSTWDVILGDPAKNIKPLDPLMIETSQRRTGTNPITGDVLVDASMPLGNPINGHEWTIPNDDLQYACIFPLLPGTARDCTDPALSACDCTVTTNDNPLCQANPNNMNNPTLQVRAKAYPSLRPLQVLRDLGSQGIVGSVCPAQLSDSNEMAVDFGYRATIEAIRNRLTPTLCGQCLPRVLPVDAQGKVPCLIVEARTSQGPCDCDALPGRRSIASGSGAEAAANIARSDPLAAHAGWNCFCELPQSSGDELAACQQDPSQFPQVNGQPVNGWCYLDASVSPPVGNPELLSQCPDNEKHNFRFVGQGEALPGATLFITCQTEATLCH